MSSTMTSTMPPAKRVTLISEKVTGPAAAEMLHLSGIANCEQASVLDNATGAGILVERLLDIASRNPHLQLERVVAGDVGDDGLGYLREKQQAQVTPDPSSKWSRVEIEHIDQHSIPFPNGSFTHVFANFGIFLSPNDSKSLAETFRVLRSGGTAGFTTWKGIRWWAELATPALAQYLPNAPSLPSPENLFPSPGWKDPKAIPEKMQRAGFTDVTVTEFDFAPKAEVEEFCEASTSLVKMIAKRSWSEADFELYAEEVESALLRYYRENFGDGKREVRMTALITIGKKP